MKRAGLYVRVSTIEQKKHGLSVDSQIVALRQYCAENGIVESGLYNDAGISARKRYTKRPALLQLISDCKDGKIDVIIFTKLDTWFRSVGDYYEVQSQLDACGVPWRAIWEDYETETSAGVFKVNIMLSVAQSEADRTSERIKAVNQYKREKGDYLGSAPLGYKVVKSDLIKDEALQVGFDAFFDTYFKTYSIAKAMQSGAENGLKLDRTHVYKLLKNPVYCGEASGGYKCEPYITRAQYDDIRTRIGANPRQTKVPNRVYLFSGIVYCGYCGRRMSAHNVSRLHANGERVNYQKYECPNNSSTKTLHPHLQIVESVLENYLLDSLESDFLVNVKSIQAKNEALGHNDAEKKKKVLEAKLKRLATLFEEGDIDVDTYRTKRDAIKLEISEIRIEPIPEPHPLPESWRLIYADLDLSHRQIFWSKIIKSISLTNDTKSHPTIGFL